MTSLLGRHEDMIAVTVTIKRAVEDVFRFYRDFRNLPSFFGRRDGHRAIGPAEYRWTIQGPLRIRANWTMRVTEERAQTN
jgi:uncharacterized membrane protein